MKKIIILLALAFLFGCESQPQRVLTDSRAVLVDQTSNYPFEIKQVINVINSGGFIEAQVSGISHISNYTVLEYRVDWKDNRGINIHSARNNQWTGFPVFRKQDFSFVAVAPNPKAKNFKIYIRDPKNNSYGVYNSDKEGEIE